MFFRNLKIYRLDDSWKYSAEALGQLLAKSAFTPCGATDMQSFGWVPPRGIEGEFVVSVAGQQLICLGIEQRILPASVIRQYSSERASELEASQGYKPGRGQIREIREQVAAELMPRAFVKRRTIYAWIDTNGRWFGIDASSGAKADEVIEQLKLALDALPLVPIRTKLSPSSVMTSWLATGEADAGFSIDRDCELRSQVEEKATVKYSRHSLEAEDVRPHLEAGKKATKLAITWDYRISFVLNEDESIKRLAFLDMLKEQAEQQAGDGDAQSLFEADFAIMSGELSRMMVAVVDALGGEAEE